MKRHAFTLTALLAVTVGCGLLDTDLDVIEPGDLESEAGARSKYIGAISEFTFAKDGDGNGAADGQVQLSGLMSDEFNLSTTPPTQQEVDQRNVNINNVTVTATYFQLHRARSTAEDAARSLQTFLADPDNAPEIPEMLSLSGYTFVYFAETFCSGVPISHFEGDSLVLGVSIPRDATLDTAIARFDSALAHPGIGADPNIEYLARIGRARALLNQGLFAQAGAEAALVPTEFSYVTEHAESPFILQNTVFTNGDGGLYSLADLEGGNGLPYRTADDQDRVPFFDTGDVGLDGSTPQFNLLKYPDPAASIPVADGIEARLIEAEAAYQAGAFGNMITFLNDLRDLVGLPNVADPGTTAGRVDLLFSERGFWLIATGHRLGDMRRLIRQYGRAEATVFPIGPYLKGGQYGTDVNIPIPIEEQNNPNFQGCIDRGA
jgi:hypothetical protein